ncbi:MAG: PKD domain-containing protein [Cytophaga sp.]|uniref:PKD domain-containing protein n=1 Tax=Cytophaga sp. TaxID=29535 RepID=UPI003F7F7A50
MKLFYQTLLTLIMGIFFLIGTAQADCCNAGFSSTRLGQYAGLYTFQFEMNDSVGSDIQFVQWGFGDGLYSTDTNPVHSYNYTGEYAVTLTVFKKMINGIQQSCSETRMIRVDGNCSNFIYFQSNKNVSFIQTAAFDIDSASAWAAARTFLWTFGDGQTSNEQNPVHSYNREGTYTTCLYQFRNDSAFADSCYVCKTFVVQDTSRPVVCNADFFYQQTDSLVSVHASDTLHASYWWVSDDTSKQYGNNAVFPVTSNDSLVICHRTYADDYDSTQYCEDCKIFYNRIPVDTIPAICNAEFSYIVNGSAVELYAVDTAAYSYWSLRINGNGQFIYHGSNVVAYVPADADVDVCHYQYRSGANDSCFVCKTIAGSMDTTKVCSSEFNYSVSGNTVSFIPDSLSYNSIHHWNFGDGSFSNDSLLVNHTFDTPGIKRICHTTFNRNYSMQVIDSCTTCKDIQIEAAEVSVHPNPAVQHVNFKSKDGVFASIVIYNVNGLEMKNITDIHSNKYQVSVSDLPKGMYYASIVLTDGRVNRSTIVVQ